MPRFELGERLTAEQRDWFETYGFIRFPAFLSGAEVRELALDVEAVDRRLVSEGRTHINGVPLVIGKRPDGYCSSNCDPNVSEPDVASPAYVALSAGGGRRCGVSR